MHNVFLSAVLGTVLLAGTASTQVTTSSVTIGGPGAHGCQGPNNDPVLSDGTAATGRIDFSFDGATNRLRVTVTNTSPVSSTEFNPVITEVWINLPDRAVTDAALTGQSDPLPVFTAAFDADILNMPQPNKQDCFGTFGLKLDSGGLSSGGIAAQGATLFAPGAGTVLAKPVTFDLQLTVDGIIDAASIAETFSAHGRVNVATAALQFEGAGASGTGSGAVARAVACKTAFYATPLPVTGSDFDLVLNGAECCHICIWVSLNPGPTQVGRFTLDIGLPVLGTFFDGMLIPRGERFVVPLTVPDDPQIVGVPIYFMNVTWLVNQFHTLTHSDTFVLTVPR